jgi:methyl-accepting chemotaxis protein
MQSLFTPVIFVYSKLNNVGRYVVSGGFFLVPVAVALYYGLQHFPPAVLGAIGATVLLAIYVYAGSYFSAISGWAVVNRLARRLNERDLRGGHESVPRGLGGQFAQMHRTLDQALGNLRGIVSQTVDSAENIRRAAGEVAAGNAHLSQRTEQQASTLEQTASGMEALTTTVKQNADNCMLASTLSRSANAVAQRGAGTVGQVVERVRLIDASSRKIVDIIGVIEGIAFQTNILALNAAVEAARAGEQGRGFAVVAAEVRALAQRSAGAAKEIKGLIEASVSDVAEGTRLVGEAGANIGEIVAAVQKMVALISQIATASSEQAGALEEINKAIAQLEGVTQQNAALVEQSGAAALSFEEEVRRLTGAVGQFKIDAPARPTAAPARPTPVAPLAQLAPRRRPAALPAGAEDDWKEF